MGITGNSGLYHWHKRKRINQKHQPFPHPNKWVRLMDKAIYVVGVAGPLMSIPQVAKIWVEQNPAGISLISWSAFLVNSLFWLAYGIIHKEKPIILAYCLWVVLNFLVVLGTLIYG